MTDLTPTRGGRLGAAGGGLASALLLWAAAPPLDVAPLAFVALLPMLWVLHHSDRPRAFMAGYVCGTVYFYLHLSWILKLSKEEVTIPWILIPALALLALYFALFQAVPIWLASRLRDRRGWSPVWTLPFLWTAFDALKAVGEIAFSWGSIGYSVAPLTSAIQMTSLAGYWVLPLWIVAVNGALWSVVGSQVRARARSSSVAGRRWKPAAALGLLLLPWAIGAWTLSRAPETVTEVDLATAPQPPGEGTVRFGLVQANTPREIKWDPDYRRIVIQDLVDQTDVIAREQRPDLIVWPETAAPLRVLWVEELRNMVRDGVRRNETWTLVGTLDAAKVEEGYEHYNSAILFDPEGMPSAKYNKRQMVPFGEFTPWKDVVPWLAEIDFGQSEFTPGRHPGQFDVEGVGRLSCLICFESTFPELARRDVADGARFLVNITNDFWFGPGSGPTQAARFAILRAVENRTPLLRCANSGITFAVDPYGRVYGETALFETVLCSFDVEPGSGPSLHTRTGNWILWLTSSLAALLAVLAWVGGGAKARARPSNPDARQPE